MDRIAVFPLALALLGACGGVASTGGEGSDAATADAGVDGDSSVDAGIGRDASVDAGPPFEADYYLSPGGDDTGPGTLAAPFRTLGRARQAVRDHRAADGLPPGGLVVALRGGTYTLEETFTLDEQDSGEVGAPVTWTAYPGEEVRISGGATITLADQAPVTSGDPLWDRLPAATREETVVVDLSALGIDPGLLRRRGWGASERTAALEPVVGDEMLTLARWPNAGQSDTEDPSADATVSGDIFGAGTTFSYLGTTATGDADDGRPSYTANVGGTDYYLYHCTWEFGGGTHRYWFISPSDPRTSANCWPSGVTSWLRSGTWPIPDLDPFGGSATSTVRPATRPEDFAEHGFLRIPETSDDTHFRLPGTRHEGWSPSAEPWFQGLFHNYWADNTLPGSVDAGGTVTLTTAPGYGISRGQPFFVMNLPEELDVPGEYYVDHDSGRLYLLPPVPLSGAELRVTVLEEPLLRVSGATSLRIVDLVFELGRTTMVELESVEDVILRGVTVRQGGGDGVQVTGSRSGLERCHLHDLGSRAVSLAGGDRPSLTRGELFVRNSDIHDFARWDRTYRAAVQVSGCGNEVMHNHLHDAPHAAILFTGNEHLFAYNRIERVVGEASDAGAIYTGRDWGYRGNLIQHNLFEDIESIFGGAVGVYLDDAASGITVVGNIFHDITGLATQSGGGRDNVFENNVVVGADRSAHSTDRRARTSNYDFGAGGRPDSWNLLGRINVDFATGEPIHYQEDPWASAYPSLAAIPNDWSLVQDSHWQDPEGSVFRYNITWRCGGLISVGTWGGSGATDHYAHIAPNLEETDPRFVDEAGGNFALREDSPVYTTDGFVFDPIPFGEIGIQP